MSPKTSAPTDVLKIHELQRYYVTIDALIEGLRAYTSTFDDGRSRNQFIKLE